MSILSLFTNGDKSSTPNKLNLDTTIKPSLTIRYSKLCRILRTNGYPIEQHKIPRLKPGSLSYWVRQQYSQPLISKPNKLSHVCWWDDELMTWKTIPSSDIYEDLYPILEPDCKLILHVPEHKYVLDADIDDIQILCQVNKISSYMIYNQDVKYGQYEFNGCYSLEDGYDVIGICQVIGIIMLIIILAYSLIRLRQIYNK